MTTAKQLLVNRQDYRYDLSAIAVFLYYNENPRDWNTVSKIENSENISQNATLVFIKS